MKRIGGFRAVKVSADGKGAVSHAGIGLLREMAEQTGLVAAVSDELIGTYKGVPVHAPGRVFTDLAVAIADGADAISGIAVLGDRTELFGQVASMPTTWRVLDRIDAGHLDVVRQARAAARVKAWVAGAGPDLSAELVLDIDATITLAHSDKQDATPTWKHSFGFHPLLCFLDRPVRFASMDRASPTSGSAAQPWRGSRARLLWRRCWSRTPRGTGRSYSSRRTRSLTTGSTSRSQRVPRW